MDGAAERPGRQRTADTHTSLYMISLYSDIRSRTRHKGVGGRVRKENPMNEHPAEAKHGTVPTTTITSILYRSCVHS